jgi:hypothetical protein
VQQRFGTNRSSIIPSDYCYNRRNKGIPFDKHIFEWLGRSQYRYLGENHPYSGRVVWQPAGEGEEQIVGEWRDGRLMRYEAPSELS